jgi:hypothetical protein
MAAKTAARQPGIRKKNTPPGDKGGVSHWQVVFSTYVLKTQGVKEGDFGGMAGRGDPIAQYPSEKTLPNVIYVISEAIHPILDPAAGILYSLIVPKGDTRVGRQPQPLRPFC